MKKKWMKLLAGVMVLALAGCGSERTRVGSGSSEDGKTEAAEAASTVVWGLCSSFEDAFPEEWQDGFNELLRERGIDIEVRFEVRTPDWEEKGWSWGDYQAFGEGFAELMGTSDIITDCGQLGDYNCYANYVKKGLYENLDAYLETPEGKMLRESCPDVFWEAVRYEGGIYGVPSQQNLYFTNYCVIPGEAAEKVSLSEKRMEASEIFRMAGELSRREQAGEDGALYKIPVVSGYVPEGYEELPGWEPFLICENDGRLQAEYMLENEDFLELLKLHHTAYKEGILYGWKEGEDIFGVWTSSYSPGAAIQEVCADWSMEPDTAVAVETGSRPFRLTGNTTGINAASKKKEEAFRILSLVFSDEELSNYLAYGREGREYHLENGRVVQDFPVTETGFASTVNMVNSLLLYPTKLDAPDRREVLGDYYESLPKSLLLGKWATPVENMDDIARVMEASDLLYGVSENLEEDLKQVSEQLSAYDLDGMRREIERRLNGERVSGWEEKDSGS